MMRRMSIPIMTVMNMIMPNTPRGSHTANRIRLLIPNTPDPCDSVHIATRTPGLRHAATQAHPNPNQSTPQGQGRHPEHTEIPNHCTPQGKSGDDDDNDDDYDDDDDAKHPKGTTGGKAAESVSYAMNYI